MTAEAATARRPESASAAPSGATAARSSDRSPPSHWSRNTMATAPSDAPVRSAKYRLPARARWRSKTIDSAMPASRNGRSGAKK